MARTTGTATEHVLNMLRSWPDNEMTLADIFDQAGGRFSKENLRQSLDRLAANGMVVKTVEGRSAWWAIASGRFSTNVAKPETEVRPEPERVAEREKALVKRATMVIPRLRY